MSENRNWSHLKVLECQQKAKKHLYAGPEAPSCVLNGKRVRAVGRKVFERPIKETHDDFLSWHLGYLLGADWVKDQQQLPLGKQHIIMQWTHAASVERARVLSADSDPNLVVGVSPTGTLQALITLADDLYRLCLVEQLPNEILTRLRDVRKFQGVRYEIAIAASMVRAGFKISWFESNETHPEFTACLAGTEETIVVEAKSRHRPGVLHESGDATDFSNLKADISTLYRRALQKPTEGFPYLISIDVNLPLTQRQAERFPGWLEDVLRLLQQGPKPTEEKPAKEFFLALTNFAWHYVTDQPAPPHELLYLLPEWASAVPKDERTLIAVFHAFDCYGVRPKSIF